MNTYWAEQGCILHTEFRDGNGNVPAGFERLRVFTHALSLLPEGIKTVRLRSDTAGYQHDLMKYCDGETKHPHLGRVEFAIGCDVTPEFRKTVHGGRGMASPLRYEGARFRRMGRGLFCSQRGCYQKGGTLPVHRHPGSDETAPPAPGQSPFSGYHFP